MEYQDLRDWIQIADEMGELKTLKGCDWNLEIGAITEIVAHKEDGPAVLFEDIKGYPKGYRVLSNSLSSRKRLALTLGLPSGETKMDFVKIWKDNYKKVKPIPPKFVEKSPLFDNVYREGDIDMFKFPTPKWHDKDGGRYIGTGSVDITRDPDEGWVNYGTYRVMIHDKNTVGFYISPGKHGRIQREKYQASGQPFKMAMSFGHDPLTFLAGSIEVPYGIPEYEFIGGIRGEPFEMIEGEYSGLPIPANAEIVIEGDVHFDQPKIEGPFGEWTGYYASAERAEPWVEVKTVVSSQRSDHSRLTSGPPACGTWLVPFLSPLRFDLGRDGKGRRAGCQRSVVDGFRRQPFDDVCFDQAALSRSCQAGGDHRVAMPRRRLSRPLRGGC